MSRSDFFPRKTGIGKIPAVILTLLMVITTLGCLGYNDDKISEISFYYPPKPNPPPILNLTNFSISLEEQQNLSLSVKATLSSSYGYEQINITRFVYNQTRGLFIGEQGNWVNSRTPDRLSVPVNNDEGRFIFTVEFLLDNTTVPLYLFNNTNTVTVIIDITNDPEIDIDYQIQPTNDLISFQARSDSNYSGHNLTIDTFIMHAGIGLHPDI